MSHPPPTDPSQSVIRASHPLTPFFKPRRVAIVGAKDDQTSVGGTLMHNLTKGGFAGEVIPVHPTRKEVLGLKAYSSVKEIPGSVDLAVIVTPAKTVPAIVGQCAEARIPAVIIISAGFKELGEPGLKLEQEILEKARAGGVRVIGPNCLGLMNPLLKFNATFAADMALPGNIAFISQSGAMCTAVLDWSFQEKIGFSSFVSIGSMADVDFGDLIDYLGSDPDTQSILIYMESIGSARSFLSAARKVALSKPIIVIKAGRTQEAAQAAASHTGSLAGSDEIFEAALERAGVLRVSEIADLFHMASVLAKQPIPKGPKLAIITNAGGPGVLATDATVLHGAEMAKLTKATIDELSKTLPEAWSHGNPVDVLGDAGPEPYAKAIHSVAGDPGVDGILVVLSPQSVTEPTATAAKIAPYAHLGDKPIVTSWMGGPAVAEGARVLGESGIPCFPYPDTASECFALMWRYSKNLQLLYQTPTLRPAQVELAPKREEVRQLISTAHQEGRTILTEFESKQLLMAYGIPVVQTVIATSAEEAASAADRIGYPAVVKLHSETITHKTDVGGVKLNLTSREAVAKAFNEILESVTRLKGKEHFQGVSVQKMISRDGYELILGSSIDPQFGPVVLFGAGGELVEVLRDSALALPPLTNTLAQQLVDKTKISHALKGVRGKPPVQMEKLLDLLVNFSQLVAEQQWIQEIDINPLLVSDKELIALDARVILHERGKREEDLPRPALRPYPYQYITSWKAKAGEEITLRPIRPEDETAMVQFHKALSEKSVRQRYLELLSLSERTAHKQLIQVCYIDYEKDLIFVAEKTKEREILGVTRLERQLGSREARFTMLIVDHFQGHGLGKRMLENLIEVGKQEKLASLYAEVLGENEVLLALCKKLGFSVTPTPSKPGFFLVQKPL